MAPYVRTIASDRVEVCSLECIEVLPLPGGGVTAICEAQARFITATLHPEAT